MSELAEKNEQIAHCVNRIRLLNERISIAEDGRTLLFPDDFSKSEWYEFHRKLLHMKRFLRVFINQSRDYASEQYGVDYVAESEVQMELSLGFSTPEPKPDLNPADKSKAIVTIEGISQSWSLWFRKMQPEIERWDRERLTKALKLIEPIETQAKAMRDRLAEIA